MATKNIDWGGQWTEEKLDAFEKYVKAYLTILNKYRDKYHWPVFYFDGFAGSGTREADSNTEDIKLENELFGGNTSAEERAVYQGAAERIVSLEGKGVQSFDRYYFIDKSKEVCDELKAKLSKYNVSGLEYFLPMDANDAVKQFAGKVQKTNARALIFIDPFGMQLNWESIESLKGLPVDLWILVPTGVIINRLLEKNYDPEKGFIHAGKLTSFFGMTAAEIQKVFYREEHEATLFGEQDIITKKENPIEKIANLYVTRLKTIFQKVTPKPLILRNNHNLPIYHFVFASNNAAAMKIAQEIIDKPKK